MQVCKNIWRQINNHCLENFLKTGKRWTKSGYFIQFYCWEMYIHCLSIWIKCRMCNFSYESWVKRQGYISVQLTLSYAWQGWRISNTVATTSATHTTSTASCLHLYWSLYRCRHLQRWQCSWCHLPLTLNWACRFLAKYKTWWQAHQRLTCDSFSLQLKSQMSPENFPIWVCTRCKAKAI